MPDEEEVTHAHTKADVWVAGINAVRDILNDWRAIMLIAIVVLMVANKLTGSIVLEGLANIVRAWRCSP